MSLPGKKIILGVCGSIAAYKAAFLVRLLVKEGAEVQVVMTEAAQEFITPLTLATLSKRPVLSQFSSDRSTGQWNNHVDLGIWADLLLVAPASAHTLAKFASGHCDDLLTAVYLSARCPVWVAPAMDLDMYQHPSVQTNLKKLASYGNTIIDAEEGELASGLSGVGRLAEPENIAHKLSAFFEHSQSLHNKKVLITAGPTQEPIDPVRYLTNASSGKMGYALAQEAARRGAKVALVSGLVALEFNHPAVTITSVTTAEEMLEASQKRFGEVDIVIFAAAVSDYAPAQKYSQKIKKKDDTLTLTLKKNPDIAQTLGRQKKDGQTLVGFALETNNEIAHARQKLEKKNLDIVVLNSLNDPGAGFEHDTNQVSLLNRKNSDILQFNLKDKADVARDIWNFIEQYEV
ncbi:bifunctional phosphopantothenoylcysteine decarboxylase/phosphopantothenate--cysteine ligase CoaBC [Tunicatimonas pelagia]|uniref:bifunctional phosphopantothenoylcysteine decarboxylase/phosphopantothenate--cysteine ligase CoaBC n=1 Tax=Tunicatimonas pelagia TaxID=931531 RepID=UPI002666EF19|nr:bifunctional phosphopantothenoylcysteine decarboxylase/phosphopantothenate--cysteine ligase CoaBC [Tunicatimonas pelagia]WKN42294.1 bifunctional phosphopantothenoylcysteine decarboxylase/phosphopantothenate--cysteine ligase CoaBC [Tunicatimonas pelagia]